MSGKMVRVSGSFAKMLDDFKKELKAQTGKDYSQSEISAFFAANKPQIIVQKKSRRDNPFDF